MSLRVLLLLGEGRYQTELLWRAASRFDVRGVLWHHPLHAKGSVLQRLARYRDPRALARYIQVRTFLPKFERAADALRNERFPFGRRVDSSIPQVEVADINSPAAVEFIRKHESDIVLVNGTNLLRKPMLSMLPNIPLGIVNLHTGLSPYSRGGNCNLFMLLEGRPELVGTTVHHISRGIDSGDIILSSQVPMRSEDNYEMVDIRTFDSGIESLLLAASQLEVGDAVCVPQWELGKLFLRRTGYEYEPYHRLLANRMLANGLVRNYLTNKSIADAGVITVGKMC